jgi:hypothetical protein
MNVTPTPSPAGERSGAVSPENPCPFLRALAAGGFIDPHAEPVSRIADLIAEAGAGSPAEKRKARIASFAIASFANGLAPTAILRNLRDGLRADALRGGPLDKRGAGSRILDRRAEFVPAELDRLDRFASDCQRPDGGGTERGLGLAQLRTMMDENFARAAGARRKIDRRLMDGEWPVLLKVMGKGEGARAYLSVAELRTLFAERQLPARIVQRIARFLRPNSG